MRGTLARNKPPPEALLENQVDLFGLAEGSVSSLPLAWTSSSILWYEPAKYEGRYHAVDAVRDLGLPSLPSVRISLTCSCTWLNRIGRSMALTSPPSLAQSSIA